MWHKQLETYLNNNRQTNILILANPYCTDDAFGYWLFRALKSMIQKKPSFNISFSYNIEIENVLLELMESNPKTQQLLVIDTILKASTVIELKSSNPHFISPLVLSDRKMPFSLHKAEWKLLKYHCKSSKIPIRYLLIPIQDDRFLGVIKPLNEILSELMNDIMAIFAQTT